MNGFELDFSSANVERILTDYLFKQNENNDVHFSYELEQECARDIINGRFDEYENKKKSISSLIKQSYPGIMSNCKSKQIEYSFVTGITLLTRYAIQAGVEDTVSYALSDITLQNLSATNNTAEMQRIYDVAFKEFAQLIKKAIRNKKVCSSYVKETKSYIEKNIFYKISLNEIAGHVGLHPVYLSRLFSSEEGISLSSYIIRQKIEYSCRLLKYSEKSISMIAECLNLAPQSYYTRVFKKVMNVSPAQYRKENLQLTKSFSVND